MSNVGICEISQLLALKH